MGGHGRVVGVDLSPGMLRVAAERSPGNCSCVVADAHRLPFGADRFDLIMCVAGLPYLDLDRLPPLTRVLRMRASVSEDERLPLCDAPG